MFLANFKPGRGAYADDGHEYTAPVNSFLPNPFNLYNMAGNVAEWVRDDFSPVYNPLVWDLNPLFTYDPETENDSPHYGKRWFVAVHGTIFPITFKQAHELSNIAMWPLHLLDLDVQWIILGSSKSKNISN